MSREAAVDDMFNLLTAVFMDHPARVPAWNKWEKNLPGLLWFACFTGLLMLLPQSLKHVCDAVNEEELELEIMPGQAGGEPDALLVGMDDQRAFRCQEQARFKKTS